MAEKPKRKHKWSMVVDIDKCIGCQACVVACQAENNIPINTEKVFLQRRANEWIRIERYWEGEWPDIKARFIPILCQHCENAPCEPVCPVYATYHNDQGLNVQIYNRCIGTRYCANNCPYQVRFFNWWQPVWPESMRNQLNPDVTVRHRGIMEKCTFCVQRIWRAERTIEGQQGGQITDKALAGNNLSPACVMACPTNTLIFGDLEDPNSQVSQFVEVIEEGEEKGKKRLKHPRAYQLLSELGTEPNVIYLKKIDPHAEEKPHA